MRCRAAVGMFLCRTMLKNIGGVNFSSALGTKKEKH